MISNEEELQSLGTRILELPEYEVRSVMHSKKCALAAREILELWRKDQPTPEDAYNNLTAALGSAGWSQVAEDLSKWEPTGEVFFSLPALTLKPREDVTRSPKRGISGPKIGMCPTKIFFKKIEECLGVAKMAKTILKFIFVNT